ncbi:MAG: DUF1697 domain-containing protein [Pseudoxanthomonas sp.]
MKTWVAFLRAVNVGGTGMLAMADLRALCERAGFADVRTYIASGNVVLRDAAGERQVKRTLEAALETHAGKPIGVMVRSGAELAAVLAANPFAGAPPNRVMVTFLDAAPAADALETVKYRTSERIALGKREIYVDYSGVEGMGALRLQIPAAKSGTARNLNTVAKLAEMTKA